MTKKTVNSKQRVYALVSRIPKGKVLTYGKISEMLNIGSPRAVGNILHANTESQHIPCHRVVNRNGQVANRYAFGGGREQSRKLQDEGIVFEKNRVDFSRALWNPQAAVRALKRSNIV